MKKTEKKDPQEEKGQAEKTRQEIEEMFSFGFGCDCDACSLHCNQEIDEEEK